MVDYDYSSAQGTLKIRDLGSRVEFWVKAGYTDFHWDNLRFNTTANLATSPDLTINYPTGAGWKMVTYRTVDDSGTVYFRLLTATGTQSLGGPTTVSKFLDRGTAPDPPHAVTFSNVGSTSLLASFVDGNNGGVGLDQRRITWSTSNVAGSAASYTASDGSTTIGGLSPNVRYYFWAQTHNSKGWSPYSAVSSILTTSVPPAPSTPVLSAPTQTSVHVEFTTSVGGSGAPITTTEVAYSNTNSVNTAGYLTAPRSTTLTGLNPGTLYYVWARSKNVTGYSAWSAPASILLVAGAWVNVGGVWKRAIPYVKVNGVWKIVEVWSREGGYWKQSAQ